MLTKRLFHVNRCDTGVIHIYYIRNSKFNVHRRSVSIFLLLKNISDDFNSLKTRILFQLYWQISVWLFLLRAFEFFSNLSADLSTILSIKDVVLVSRCLIVWIKKQKFAETYAKLFLELIFCISEFAFSIVASDSVSTFEITFFFFILSKRSQ